MSIRRNQAPDVTGLLNSYVGRYRDAWNHAHREGDPRAGEWIRLAVQTLRAEHPAGQRWVLNGKRGDPNNPSWDIVGYRVDEANGDDRMIECYDVIAGAGGPNPSIYWGNVTNYDTMGQSGTAVAIVPPPLAGQPPSTPPAAGATWTVEHASLLARMPSTASIAAIAQQFAHSFPEDAWGEKSTAGGAQSRDTLGRRAGTRFYAYRVIPRGGAPDEYDLTGSDHKFYRAAPVNHLGDDMVPTPPAPTPAPNPTPSPTPPSSPPSTPTPCLDDIFLELKKVEATLGELVAAVEALEAQQSALAARKFPTYDAQIFGRPVTFTPREG